MTHLRWRRKCHQKSVAATASVAGVAVRRPIEQNTSRHFTQPLHPARRRTTTIEIKTFRLYTAGD